MIDLAYPPVRFLLTVVWVIVFVYRYAKPHKPLSNNATFLVLLKPPQFARWQALALVLLMAVAAPWVQSLMLGGSAVFATVDSATDSTSRVTLGVLVFALSVIAVSTSTYPLLEEFFTRAWLFVSLTQRYSHHTAIILSSAVFTIVHLTTAPGLVFERFVFGVALGYAVVFTNSIWTAVGMHYMWNLCLNYFQLPITRDIQTLKYLGVTPNYPRAWIATLACVGLYVALLVSAQRVARRRTHEFDLQSAVDAVPNAASP